MARIELQHSGPAIWAFGLGLVLLVVGGAGFHRLTTFYETRIAAARAPVETISVIVAARDLYQGMAITEDDLFEIDVAPEYIPGGVLTSAAHAIGRIPRERILANEFLRTERLSDAQRGVGLNAIIPRGMRAISVNVAHAQGGSGFVRPEDYVDVILTMADPITGVSRSQVVIEAAYVLAVDDQAAVGRQGDSLQSEAPGAARPRRLQPSVTFAVTPSQAERLAHAAREGQLQVTMRNGMDPLGSQIDKTHVTMESLFGVEAEPSAPRVVPSLRPCPRIRIYRGDRVSEEAWAEGDCL